MVKGSDISMGILGILVAIYLVLEGLAVALVTNFLILFFILALVSFVSAIFSFKGKGWAKATIGILVLVSIASTLWILFQIE